MDLASVKQSNENSPILTPPLDLEGEEVRFYLPPDSLKRIRRAYEFLQDSYMSEDIDLAKISKMACLSAFHFQRMYHKAFLVSPATHIKNLRLQKAKRLLAGDQHSITEICFLSGYQSLGTFSTWFKKATGYSPRQYRLKSKAMIAVPNGRYFWDIPSCFTWFSEK